MNLSEFYDAVVPQDGKRILAFLSKKGMQHVVCNSHAELQKATIKTVKAGHNVFYAMASYKQGWHTNPKTGKNQLRTQENVHQIKALWFDIDFKGRLSNPTEVVAAIREFCNATRMPAPSILVHSGNGFHVYWPFTKAISRSRWQPLADALKTKAMAIGLDADTGCTADAARVLRPIGTRNLKDKNNPKPVVAPFASGKLFDPGDLETTLLGECSEGRLQHLHLGGSIPEYLLGAKYSGELAGGVGKSVESFIPNIAKKCGVISHILETNGEDCVEPEWVASLQLAKHCADGELYFHDLSKGHKDYTPEDTNEKWQQRLDNEAGPTLCDTFAAYRPDICKTCPHRGSIKTPLSLGEEEIVIAEGKEFPVPRWRPIEGDNGMETQVWDKGAKQFFWEKVLNRTWELHGASSDILTNVYTLSIGSRLAGSKPIAVEIPARLLGDSVTLKKELAENGVAIEQLEVAHWIRLMNTWLQEIQKKRTVGKAVSRMGWIEERQPDHSVIKTGFTCGSTAFYANGDKEEGLRVSAQYKQIASSYLPTGDYEVWKEAADFIADQNIPAFTAILASAFGTPLFGYTNMPGAMLTLVSRESGLGKTSVMKTAQAVWGSPVKGMNSTSDTTLSIFSKTAFLKNLPVYWDEIRGEKALASFYDVAFQIAQGKDKTRLNSNAEQREVHDWKTMAVGASNESIFDYMAQCGGNSDAATARTFEVEIQPFNDPTRAARNAMFGLLDSNYGHAGLRYAEYISIRHKRIGEAVKSTYENLYTEWGFSEGERFWCATIASLLVGAAVAKAAGIVSIDVKTLKAYLLDRSSALRAMSGQALKHAGAREIVHSYLQRHQNETMVMDKFPKPGPGDPPIVERPPANKTLTVVQVGGTYRFNRHDFVKWLRLSHGVSFSSIEKEFMDELHGRSVHTQLGAGSGMALPRSHLLEVTF